MTTITARYNGYRATTGRAYRVLGAVRLAERGISLYSTQPEHRVKVIAAGPTDVGADWDITPAVATLIDAPVDINGIDLRPLTIEAAAEYIAAQLAERLSIPSVQINSINGKGLR